MTPLPFADLTADEAVVVAARLRARRLGTVLVLNPVDAAVYQELADFLAGQGREALHAMNRLDAVPIEQLMARAQAAGGQRERTAGLRLLALPPAPLADPEQAQEEFTDWFGHDQDATAAEADPWATDGWSFDAEVDR